jgi:hypothetical protein
LVKSIKINPSKKPKGGAEKQRLKRLGELKSVANLKISSKKS